MALAKAYSGSLDFWIEKITTKYGDKATFSNNEVRTFATVNGEEVGSWSSKLHGGWILAN